MNLRTFLLPIFCLLLAGCGKSNQSDKDSFQLTVDKLIDDGDTRIAILKIESPRKADLQLRYKGKHGGSFESVQLSPDINGTMTEGQVVLNAAKVDGDTNWAWIHVVTKAGVTRDGGDATGTANYPVRPATKLENFYSIVAADGTYKFFQPLTIVSLDGEPVTLTLTNAPN